MEYTYLDLYGNPTRLSDKEIIWFKKISDECKAAIGIEIPIECADHEQIKGHRDALGIFYADNPSDPLQGNCLITIDNYFIHECYNENFHNGYNLTYKSLDWVIAHEFAHAFQRRHCKRHTKLTEDFYQKIRAYQVKLK